jgi:hypothetical protein
MNFSLTGPEQTVEVKETTLAIENTPAVEDDKDVVEPVVFKRFKKSVLREVKTSDPKPQIPKSNNQIGLSFDDDY